MFTVRVQLLFSLLLALCETGQAIDSPETRKVSVSVELELGP